MLVEAAVKLLKELKEEMAGSFSLSVQF